MERPHPDAPPRDSSHHDTWILLVRHGETTWNCERRIQGQTDAPLNERGRAQAVALARRLSHVALDVAFSSDLGRSLDTARLALDANSALLHSLHTHAALRERSFGDWEGLTLEEIEQTWDDDYRAWRSGTRGFRPPGGEDRQQLYDRVAGFLEEAAWRFEGLRLVAFTHGGAVNCAVAHALSAGPEPALPLAVPNGAITTLRCRSGQWTVAGINDTCHLAGLEASGRRGGN